MILSNILLIFGSSGGVLEAAVRTSYNMLTGDDLEQLEFKELKEMKGIKESSIEILGKEVKVAVASGLQMREDFWKELEMEKFTTKL